MSPRPVDRRPIIISGPSGVGKGTLAQKLIDKYPDTFALTVSHTTRSPRVNEIDGKSYHFVSATTFTTLLSQDAFVEHTTFNSHQYGTSKAAITDITDKGLIAVLDIEIDGVQQIRGNSSIDARYVFIKPPSLEALGARLRSRGTESEIDVLSRLTRARDEIEFAETQGVYGKIIVNDDLERAYGELEELMFR
ncbi:uncharacterized protein N7496_003697 [Penicillium cataractarum]|uniref:guanylate kinase n=1 Tax=Penicillium cataractarum TaxID=2100454 RepID=A0A9W9SP38_9EURO|nr:uncharacterized protein N7496_003697 [Penicillium cataractarum]KAJ5381269.1 hypothetical protein N7496_003697 [Penicillium cataractarum]